MSLCNIRYKASLNLYNRSTEIPGRYNVWFWLMWWVRLTWAPPSVLLLLPPTSSVSLSPLHSPYLSCTNPSTWNRIRHGHWSNWESPPAASTDQTMPASWCRPPGWFWRASPWRRWSALTGSSSAAPLTDRSLALRPTLDDVRACLVLIPTKLKKKMLVPYHFWTS